MPTLDTDRPGSLARFVGVAAAYFAAARLGVAFIAEPESIAVFWPPAGLLLGYLLVTDRRHWLVTLAAAVAATVVANLSVGKGIGECLGFAVVNAVEPAVGAWVIGRLRCGTFRLRSARDLALMYGVPAVVCAVTAVGGAAVVVGSSDAPFWSVWKVWWAADALGVVLFAPLVVCWADPPAGVFSRRAPRVLAEAVAPFTALTVVSWGIFATPSGEKPLLLTLPYPVFPLLLWVALRLGGRGTAPAVCLVSLIAVWGSARALGPVSAPLLGVADRVLVVQGFCAVVSLSTFLLAVAVAERRAREREILSLNESLHQGLAERQEAVDGLRTQKQILETILDSMGEAVLVADATGAMILKNRSFRAMHDTPAPPTVADWPRAFGVYMPDGKTLCPSDGLPIFRAARGEPCDNVELMIVDAAHPDGLPVSVTGRPILGPNGVEGGVIAIRDVSAVRQAEAERRASEQRYRYLVDGVRDYAIFLLTPTGHVASWNIGAERIKGYTEREIVGQHFSRFYPPEDVAAGKTDNILRTAAEAGQYEAEGWRVRKDGTQFWAHVVISAVLDADGRLQGFAKATRDLTAKRVADFALRQSELRFRAIFDQTLQFIGLMAADGTLLEANRTALAATGIAEADVLGRKFWDTPWWTHDAAQQEKLRDAVRRAAAGETVRFEAHHPAADGGTIWVDFSLKPYVADGDVLYLIPEGRDITERKRTEQALAANEALLHQFVKHAPAAIAMLDHEMRYVRTSDRWVQDYRLTGDEILGRSHYDVFPDIPERWKEIHRRVLAGAVESCAEDPFPRADGGTEWLQWEARPWHDASGGVGGLIFFTQVITEQVEAKRRATVLLAAARVLAEPTSPADAIVRLLREVCEERGWELGEFWRVSDDSKELELVAGWPAPEVAEFARSHDGLRFQRGIGLPGRAWASARPQVISDLSADPGFLRRAAAIEHGLRTGLSFPVTVGSRVIGVFVFLTRRATPPAPQDVTLLYELAGKLGLWVEQKRAASALVASEARFRAVFDASPSGLILVNREGRITLANDLTHRMFGWPREELTGALIEQLVPERYQARHPAARDAYFDQPRVRAMGAGADLAGRRKDGSEFPVEIGLTPVRADGEVFVLASVVDITARRRTEVALRLGEERLRLALENARHGLWDWGVRDGSLFLDDTWALVHGYSPGELPVSYEWWESSIHPDDRQRVLNALGQHLTSDDALYDVEYRARRKDGGWVWVNSRGRVQERDATGRAVRMMGTMHDISERKRAQDDLVRSVREKEFMLREIHHRVKNNLAVISSLFRIQARAVEGAEVREVLVEAQKRVLSMALVHEHLYNSDDLGAVSFGDYAKSLAAQIVQTYQLPTTPVDLSCDVREVRLSIEQSIPCGLILNEVLSNCLKHAFRDRARGRVELSVEDAGGTCVIRVRDDGAGVPKDFGARPGRSLGVRLIEILTRQLVGTVEYLSPGPGTEVRLSFPIRSASDHGPRAAKNQRAAAHGDVQVLRDQGAPC